MGFSRFHGGRIIEAVWLGFVSLDAGEEASEFLRSVVIGFLGAFALFGLGLSCWGREVVASFFFFPSRQRV